MSRASLLLYLDNYLEAHPPSDPESLLCRIITTQPTYPSKDFCFHASPNLGFLSTHYRFFDAAFASLIASFSSFKDAESMQEISDSVLALLPISRLVDNMPLYGISTFLLPPHPPISILSNFSIY